MHTSNKSLRQLEDLQAQATAIGEEKEGIKQDIRNGFTDRAVVFVDMVNSTQFKQQHPNDPEVWILRAWQFCKLVAAAVTQHNGLVVKFIGDEVMASFENTNDALGFIVRVEEIENNLKRATGHDTRIKVIADFGKVYNVQYDGHNALDPQGPCVDRCARIGKYGMAGEVLASFEFVEQTSKLNWKKLGSIDLKGLGQQLLYQLDRVTIDITPTIEVKLATYQQLQEEAQELRIENNKLRDMNHSLAHQLADVGKSPSITDLAFNNNDDEQEAAWNQLEKAFEKLGILIAEARVGRDEYARFLFLHEQGRGDTFNKYENRDFSSSIEAGLVDKHGASDQYTLNLDHPRNKKALQLIADINSLVDAYVGSYGQNEADLFDWKLSSPEFWEKYLYCQVR